MRGDHVTALSIHGAKWINQQLHGPRRRIESRSSEIEGRFDPTAGNQAARGESAPQSLRAISAGLPTSTSGEPSPLSPFLACVLFWLLFFFAPLSRLLLQWWV